MKIVVLTGAGISAESGINTFRDKGGLWEKHAIEDVATPQAWQRNPELVLNFYNQRRTQLLNCKPNLGHYELVKWQATFDVHVITQNVDNLHELAGQSNVLHLHGELTKARSTGPSGEIVHIKNENLNLGDTCVDGFQLRPHIVWFGEEVPEMENAERVTASAEALVIVGTSLNVYPAASLAYCVNPKTPIYLVDPNDVNNKPKNAIHIKEKASIGLKKLTNILLHTSIE